MSHREFLAIAINEAVESQSTGCNRQGAVLVKADGIVARSHNRSIQLNDPIAVAEMDCIRKAGRRNDQQELTLYTTRYPDMLIAGAIVQFSIGSVVIGLPEHSNQALDYLSEKSVPVFFLPIDECSSLMES